MHVWVVIKLLCTAGAPVNESGAVSVGLAVRGRGSMGSMRSATVVGVDNKLSATNNFIYYHPATPTAMHPALSLR